MTVADDAWAGAVSAARLGRGIRVRPGAGRRPPERPLELWEFEACPFCRKVREGLSELDLSYVCHPCARGSAHRDEVPSPGGRKSFPYLRDPNTGAEMAESEDILDYLHATYGPRRRWRERWLAPLNTLGSAVASALRPRGGVARRGRPPEERLVLYQYEGCPFCRKVRERLHELDLVHLVQNVARGSARRPALEELGGKVQVPFLVDPNTGTSMYESDAIVAYLDATYG
ncbi:MAG TPA: glutathione S-transferase N-terminal domain-containing protein [Sandaracinaceae bacterium LLY-WYZ-13_1]|nr:glutathione S-transferase N-terminal domain-containing protein [Sandaracinaceae bacterium LLY-WYZ-13_1]